MRALNRVALVMLILLVGMGFVPRPGGARMIKLSLAELAAKADTIVLGTVVSRASSWNSDGTAIHTDVTVSVEEVIRGAAESHVTFRVAGGIVGGIGMRTSNDPVFHDGEQVIVFLNTREIPPSLVGLYQGKVAVQQGIVKRNGQSMSVTDFINAVRDALSAP